jgi:hypothetical protein
MTETAPVDRISALLVPAGYQRIKAPIKIGPLDFDVPAAFVGTTKSMDLVLVFDTAFQQMPAIQQTVVAIARALDIARSRRPLTTILAGYRAEARLTEPLARVSRILWATDPSKDVESLAVLLPLRLPPISEEAPDVADVLASLKSESKTAAEFVRLAEDGKGSVEAHLIELVEAPFAKMNELGGGL